MLQGCTCPKVTQPLVPMDEFSPPRRKPFSPFFNLGSISLNGFIEIPELREHKVVH
jgi:hypothetical protein